MNARARLALVCTAALALTAAPGVLVAAAAADPGFGDHVSDCALVQHVGADHNPGLHRGAAGWDGTACHVA